jgi:hypothetical protein
MKTVFTSAELPHVWAHKSAPHGRCPGNLSFNGPAILSYATEIARHCEHKGKPFVIFNATSYSVTTAKAQNEVRRAIPGGVPVFVADGIGRGMSLADVKPSELFDHAVKTAAIHASKAAKARTGRDSYLAAQAACIRKAGEISAFFGLRRKVDEKTVSRLAAAETRAKAKAAKLAREREKARLARDAEEIAAWLAGDAAVRPSYHWPVMLRAEGLELVTTKGARVPLADAERTFRFASALRSRGWHKNGEAHTVGGYQLDAVNDQGIVAGCHRIAWPEIERFAKAMAW